MNQKGSATQVLTDAGNVYHLACKRGDLAEYILLVGDPERAQKVASRFDRIDFESKHREFVILTGTFQNVRLSVLSTGISQSNMEIAVIEACQITQAPTFIRCGSCGALQEDIDLGDLIISTGSVKIEDTTSFFAPSSYPAIAHNDCVLALALAARSIKTPMHIGLTASTSGFYGAQGREIPGFPILNTQYLTQLAKLGVKNFEMETATLFVLSQIRGLRAGAICAAYANRPKDIFANDSQRDRSEQACIEVALQAFLNLHKMDADRSASAQAIWLPNDID